jgi:hypothetical protein
MAPSLRSPRRLVGASLLAAAVATACGSGAAAPANDGGGGGGDLSPVGQPAGGQPGGQPAGPAGGQGSQSGGQGNQSGGQGNQPGGQGNEADGDLLAVLPDGTRIVYTGSLRLEVENIDAAVKAGRQVVGRVGGYLAGSSQTRDEKQQVASITYRIPAERWEDALDALRALGTVVGEDTDAEEVTSQLVDLEARIRNLRASEAAVMRLTEDASGIDELLTVESRLAALRGQIEQLDAQRAALEDRAAFGTLTVTFATVATIAAAPSPTPSAAPAWDAGRDVSAATSTLVGMLQAVTSAGIWFGIVWLPVLAVVALVLLAVRVVLRRTGLAGDLGRIGPSGS